MTELLFQLLPELGRSVLERLRAALEASADDRIRTVLPRIPRSMGGEPFRLVVTGEYNAGKSSLLQALTGDAVQIQIHSNVTTPEAREYTWRNVRLVDTPGVRAGTPLHDERAERALREADLIVFVITPEAFDDEAAEHLRHVAFELGKLDLMLVVVNKAASMRATPGVREEAVRSALRTPSLPLPMIECDAKSALEAGTAPDAERADFLSRRGNLAGLETALNELVATEGTTGRWKVPFDAGLAAVDDLQPFLEPESEELAMAQVLERRHDVLAQSRLRLHNRLEDAFGSTYGRIIAIGEVLVLAAKDGAVPGDAVSEFEQAARSEAEALEGKVQRAFEREQAELAAEERGLAEGPEVQTLLDAGLFEADVSADRFRKPSGQPGLADSPFVQMARERLAEGGKTWLKDTLSQGNRPGSPMHDLVLTVGHQIGHKFKPWEAVKWTRRLNIAATAGLALFDFVSETRALTKEEDDVQRHQLALRAQVRDAAEALVEVAREEVAPLIERFFVEAGKPLVETEERLAALSEDRTTLTRELEVIRTDCHQALDLIGRSEKGTTLK